jgi:hypothetical protein
MRCARPIRPLAGLLAVASLLIGAAAEVLSVRHLGGPLGLVLFGVAAVVAVLAWLALGAPVTRRSAS